MSETATLTDRYVDAAMRTVPERQRDDLGAELRGSIADQIDAREDAGEARDAAERAVLIELGDPEKLAAGYTGRQLHLIGPRYYLDWWRLLKLLLWIVLPCTAFGVALGQTLSGAAVGSIIGSAVVAMLTAALHVCFWTTLVFVILERTGHETMDAGPWTPDRLPEPRERGAGFGDLVASLVWLLILAGAIVWDVAFGWVPGHVPGDQVSFLTPAMWPTGTVILLGILALSGVLAVVVYVRRRWTYPLAAVNAALALAVVLLFVVYAPPLNDGFFAAIADEDAAGVQRIVTIVLWFALAGGAAWSILDGFLKARRAARVG
jgi:hypothetical protein